MSRLQKGQLRASAGSRRGHFSRGEKEQAAPTVALPSPEGPRRKRKPRGRKEARRSLRPGRAAAVNGTCRARAQPRPRVTGVSSTFEGAL